MAVSYDVTISTSLSVCKEVKKKNKYNKIMMEPKAEMKNIYKYSYT